MDAVTLVADALQAVANRDIDRHMMYFADDIVMEQGFGYAHSVHGKAAYREHVTQFRQLPAGTGLIAFEVLAAPDLSTDNLIWSHAVLHHRNLIHGPDGGLLTTTDVSDGFFAVEDNKIKIIKGFARPNVWRFESLR